AIIVKSIFIPDACSAQQACSTPDESEARFTRSHSSAYTLGILLFCLSVFFPSPCFLCGRLVSRM
ncbi:MAG: hypothetical protein KKB32_09065, partial [Acidobacteria bacterium]|nr:hypothetical protein [Acidobacteriota bacterium]